MPVQTQSRNQPGTTPDPFSDPSAIRLVPPLPPKVPSKRETGMDSQRETTNTRSQDPHRVKPIRSQTQQTVGSVDHLHLLRFDEYSLFLTSLIAAAAVPKSLLPVAPYLKTPRQYHPSRKNPSLPSAQARRAPLTQTLSIVSILQALVPVRLCSYLPYSPIHPGTVR